MGKRKKITWERCEFPLDDLRPYEANPRRILKKQFEDLVESLTRYGQAEPIVINRDKTIIGGHARLEAMKQLPHLFETADCLMPDRTLKPNELQELNIRLNKNVAGEFDFDILANYFDADDLVDWGFEPLELGLGKESETDHDESDGDAGGENVQKVTCPNCDFEFKN